MSAIYVTNPVNNYFIYFSCRSRIHTGPNHSTCKWPSTVRRPSSFAGFQWYRDTLTDPWRHRKWPSKMWRRFKCEPQSVASGQISDILQTKFVNASSWRESVISRFTLIELGNDAAPGLNKLRLASRIAMDLWIALSFETPPSKFYTTPANHIRYCT